MSSGVMFMVRNSFASKLENLLCNYFERIISVHLSLSYHFYATLSSVYFYTLQPASAKKDKFYPIGTSYYGTFL